VTRLRRRAGAGRRADQAGKGFAQIRDGGLRGVTFTVRAHARTQLGVRALTIVAAL
jgi:hypothetical protein